ncbi:MULTISPECIES: hypothetical protein, partial [unclassified Frankia]|uniref:hypothetical protein n=1 Tax=unclassified Frankia TaxID=2632575 RepID=UPI002AD421C1
DQQQSKNQDFIHARRAKRRPTLPRQGFWIASTKNMRNAASLLIGSRKQEWFLDDFNVDRECAGVSERLVLV